MTNAKHMNKQLIHERRIKVQAYKAMHPEVTLSELAVLFDVKPSQITQDLAADLPTVIDYVARDAAIYEDYQNGATYEQLNEKYGLKISTLKNVVYSGNVASKPNHMCSKDKKADIIWEELSRKGVVPARVA